MILARIWVFTAFTIACAQRISNTGRCGADYRGFVCKGSSYGDCCSQLSSSTYILEAKVDNRLSRYGYCSSTPGHCGTGCDPAYGTCTGGKLKVSTDGTCGSKSGYTCQGSVFGNCCSQYGYWYVLSALSLAAEINRYNLAVRQLPIVAQAATRVSELAPMLLRRLHARHRWRVLPALVHHHLPLPPRP
jgi:hypothetical protein